MSSEKPANDDVAETAPRPEIPESYVEMARVFLDVEGVIEVWAMASPLPEIQTPQAAVTLDSGVWFVCRTGLPMLPGGVDGIVSFVVDGEEEEE